MGRAVVENLAGVNTNKHAKHNKHLSTILKFGGCALKEELLRPVTKTEDASHSCAAQEGGCTDYISDCTRETIGLRNFTLNTQ